MSHFANLGLPENASQDAIKKAYRKLAKRYHPDINKEAGAASKFVSINQSYEWLMEGRYKLNTAVFHATQQANASPFNPVNEFDIDGDGKLSAEEWKRMKKLKLEEAARAFYNLLQTSTEYKIWVGSYYVLCILFMVIDLYLWLLAYLSGGIGPLIVSGVMCVPLFFGMLLYFLYSEIANEHRTYIKIIRKFYDPKFKILGVFNF